MLVQGADEKKNDERVVCNNVLVQGSVEAYNSLEVYNLWYAYVPIICWRLAAKVMKFLRLVWFTYQLTRKYIYTI